MTFWGVMTLILMIVAGAVSFIPVLPGPALVWAIGLIYAAATGFAEVSVTAVVWMTLLMIIGSTADWWTKLFGLGAEGSLSCGSFAVSTIGAIAGTFLIPIPVVGTLLGAAAGVAMLVFYQEENWQKALVAARGIMVAWIATFFIEFAISLGIVTIFARTLLDAWGMFG
ncbi:MAG: DUF456 domain-containing protein [Chloroflexota bacterium]